MGNKTILFRSNKESTWTNKSLAKATHNSTEQWPSTEKKTRNNIATENSRQKENPCEDCLSYGIDFISNIDFSDNSDKRCQGKTERKRKD